MNRSLLCLAATVCVIVGLLGCANGRGEPGLGTSTERANPRRDMAKPSSAAPQQQPYQAYGEPMKLSDTDAMPVGKVLANPAAFEGQYVRLVGDVSKVCTRKGCWLEMADSNTRQPLFVKFTCPVDGRLIPMEAIGKPVVVEGKVTVKEISEEDARHLKEESGASDEEVARIRGPQKQITLESPAARVAGL